jgi:N-acetylglucosamine kinase-like BadF-type ATPase
MKSIIGVDGGGTKTLALLPDLSGRVLARGLSGPCNYNATGFDAACAALESAISIAREDYPGEISALCLGLAGAGRKEDIERFQNWAVKKFPRTRVKVANDAEVLLMAGAPLGPALALVCGTGSIVFGRTATGELIRAGGWGYLFGDEGSGYTIGQAALRAVMQAHDGRGPVTLLTELVLKQRGLSEPAELVRNIYEVEGPQVEVASLSSLVEEAAGRGDVVAAAILEESARELARTIAAVYPKLGAAPSPLVITGGTIIHGVHLKAAFHRACENLGLTFSVVHYLPEPAEGAVQLARKLLSD